MRIMAIDNTKFCGIPVSEIKIKGINSDYKLFDITRKDFVFLNDMYKSVNLKNLVPNLKEKDFDIWNGLLKSAIESSKSTKRKVFIETCDNTPCGILNYSEEEKYLHLNYVIAFPNKPEYRVPCAGQIMMHELFKRFLEGERPFIKMQALKESPYDPISKYLKLGYRMLGGDNYTEEMSINKERALISYLRQNDFIFTRPLLNQPEQDLSKTVKLLCDA
ncbi:hypothetical protein IKP85_07595 [bacterium]|nr:hypothetical protein [bacterium]